MGNAQQPVKLKGNRNLLLVGKAGTGKSSTGNTILGEKVFYTEDSGSAVTLNASVARGRFDGYTLKVIDTAGVRDPRVLEGEQRERAVRNISEGFLECRDGFHAVLVVVHYSSRFTDEDQEIINLLREKFGHDILQRHGIVAVTRGEAFAQYPDRHTMFSEWWGRQEGGLRDLIRECGQRVILFSNSDSATEQESRDHLFRYLNPMTEMFTNNMFQANQ